MLDRLIFSALCARNTFAYAWEYYDEWRAAMHAQRAEARKNATYTCIDQTIDASDRHFIGSFMNNLDELVRPSGDQIERFLKAIEPLPVAIRFDFVRSAAEKCPKLVTAPAVLRWTMANHMPMMLVDDQVTDNRLPRE
jgi:hypothetical protein